MHCVLLKITRTTTYLTWSQIGFSHPSERVHMKIQLYFWRRSGQPTIEGPARDQTMGPTKIPKRIKGVNESPTKGKKVTTHGRVMRCQHCGIEGHYASTCKNRGCTTKPRKRGRTEEEEEGTQGTEELPQGSQGSQELPQGTQQSQL